MKSYKKLDVFKRIGTFFKYVLDKKVPFYKKIIIILGFLYLLLPFDIIPDPVLGLGIIDDITILIFIFNMYSNELNKYEENNVSKSPINDKIVKDVHYTVKDDKEEGD